MKIQKLTVDNIYRFEHVEIEPGRVIVIEGGNDTGKSTLLRTFLGATQGGYEATLLRRGASSGKLVLVTSDGVQITRKAGPSSTPVSVEHPELGKLAAPAAYLDELTDVLSVNPLVFMQESAKKQTAMLLDLIDIAVSDEELRKAGVSTLPPASRNGLERIQCARELAYNQRTGVNRAAKEKQSTVAQLEQSLPPGHEEADWDAAAEAAEAERQELEARAAQETAGEATSVERAKAKLAAARAERVSKLKEECAAAVRELEKKRDGAIEAAKQEERTGADLLERSLTRHRVEAEGRIRARVEELAGAAATARERAKAAARNENTRSILRTQRAEAAHLVDESAALTSTLQALDELKLAALAKLPMRGVEIVDGVIHIDGFPMHVVNTAKRVRFWLNVAMLRLRKLRVICVDGLECLDEDTFRTFEKVAAAIAQEHDVQFFVTRVTQGALAVRTDGEYVIGGPAATAATAVTEAA